MKIILIMAVSANGIIATTHGSEDFLSHENWLQFVNLAKQVGCIVWGRKTYEKVIAWDKSYLDPLKDIKKVILSNSDINLKNGFILAHSPEEALEILEKKGFKETIVTGGATVNTEFAKIGLIDEVILFVNPSVVGVGIPVFAAGDFMMKLKLIDVERVNDDIVKIRYKVVK